MSNPRRSSIQADYDRTRIAAGAPPASISFAEVRAHMSHQERKNSHWEALTPEQRASQKHNQAVRRGCTLTDADRENNQRNAAAFLAKRKQSGDWSAAALEPPQKKMIEKMRAESCINPKIQIGRCVQ